MTGPLGTSQHPVSAHRPACHGTPISPDNRATQTVPERQLRNSATAVGEDCTNSDPERDCSYPRSGALTALLLACRQLGRRLEPDVLWYAPCARRCGLPTALASNRISLAIDKTSLAIDRDSLAIDRISLAIDRTSLAIDRTNMLIAIDRRS